MEETSTPETKKATPLTRALDTIKVLRRQLAEREGTQPVAVIGAGLRLPGGIDDLDGYWNALAGGRDLVHTLPPHRREPFAAQWEGLPLRGGFLDEVLDFDAAFFGISPREARHLDPQHRLLLEVAWEALEHAALPADRLGGLRTGLYLGIMWQDYREWLEHEPDAYATTGNGHNFAAGRIAHALGLTGPALSVDTACSSSLVAVHLAVQALRRGECEVAFAAGTNLIMSPRTMRLVQETRSLSPDGTCKTFDARANGFVRGEGCAALVLKRLDHARRDGDRILGVIHGTAVNQDGRAGGFTAPNVLAQVAVIEAALAEAGLEPADIGHIEAHGTGTSLGDPIEMEALATALGRRNGGAPLPVGSVKTNLGHLESAAGITGLVKALLAIRHRQVPPVLHFRTLNPRIDLTGTGITVPTELTDWPGGAGRYAGVSSFGMSGTNAHVVLGPAPEETGAPPAGPVTGFELSARTPEALRELAARCADRLAALDPADYPAFADTATHGRARLEVRARVAAADPAAAVDALRALAEGRASAAVVVGEDIGDRPAAPPSPRRVADLPAYPWQRQRYAPETLAAAAPEPSGPVAHQLVWEPLTQDGGSCPLVLAGDDVELLGRLAAAADGGTLLVPEGTLTAEPGWTVAPLPTDEPSWRAFWAGRTGDGPAALVLAPRAHDLPASGERGFSGAGVCATVTTAVRAMTETDGRAFVVTRAARRTTGQDSVPATDHGALHGLAPALGLEAPAVWGGVVDLPAESGPADARALLGLAAAQLRRGRGESAEDLVAVRDGTLLGARLRPAPGHRPGLTVRADATYLVTGALGAVGRELTAELVRRGARHLLLVGRRAEPELGERAAGFLAGLRADGVRAEYRGGGCDTREAVAACLDLPDGMPPLRGVVHAAGTLERVPLDRLGAAGLADALAGKADGAWWLHLALRERPLDFFTLISSVSAVWGTEGCAAYAAANGALDALAAHRASLGLPATAVAYGPWAVAGGEGMADEEGRRQYARAGVGALDAATGRAALTGTAEGPAGHVVACPLDLARLAEVTAAVRARALLAPAAGGADPNGPGQPREPGEPSVVAELAALPARARAGAARGHVARLAAGLLGHADTAAIRTDAGFLDLGLDSIMAVDLAARLAQAFETDVTVADVFDHPTVERLAAHLLAQPAAAPVRRTVPAAPAPVEATGPQPGERPGESTDEPVAIVGMAGRFPGADSVEEFWQLLMEGRDGVTTVPDGRWDTSRFTGSDDALGAGRIVTDQGGFLKGIDRFDAAFFDIPVREAENLDPQQRMLLESSWHALEHGGIDPRSLRGSRTGVFVGVSYSDYARVLAAGGPDRLDAYYSTGTALNAAAGRLSYTLGLNGPALAVDTACSSSLVALHLAVRSLRSGESDAALAGGVNVLLDPASWIAVSRAHMLSPDGRCRTFSADAAGFVRSEACGVLVLKRLTDARRDGDRVLAVIRGTAVNQDGASSGLTAPSGTAQEAMLRAALADAGVGGAEVSYLEAHGTGTSLGDPIEVGAAWRALGEGRRPGEPLHLGSVKSNVGHCESAAGVVGVIKTVLALQHDVIPGNLHFARPNPHVPWADMNVRVVDAPTPWRRGERPRVAGVSGFGFTGTNAHVVLSDPPAPQPAEQPPAAPDATQLIPLSAPDAEGLARLAETWREMLAGTADDDLAAVAAAAARRAHFPHRAALLGRTREQLAAGLRALPARGPAARPPRIAFLFSGQGSQYFGMGRELYETEPVFRDVFDRCDQALAGRLGASLADLTLYGADPGAVDDTRVTQPALVALELALAALWESWGVTPALVMGHSVGEIAAAVHAGVMDLPTGLGLIAERARLMHSTGEGAMLSVVAPEERVLEWTDGTGLDIAAVNAPEATVVAGDAAAVDALAARLTADGVRVRRLTVSRAFHSRLLDPVLPGLRRHCEALEFGAPDIPVVSNVTGRLAGPDTYDADYWCRHARRPVRFLDGARQLAAQDIDVCLEIGPDRTLVNLVRTAGLTPSGGAVSSLRRGGSDRAALLTAAKALYEQGQDLNWGRIYPAGRYPRGSAPLYPFADTRYWAPAAAAPAAPAPPAGSAPPWGVELRSPALQGRVFVTERSTAYPPHLTDHRLFGVVSVPGASQTATVLSALGHGGDPVALEDLHFPRALVLHDGERYETQTVEREEEHGTRVVGVHSLVDPEHGRWQQHLAARVTAPGRAGARTAPDPRAFIATADRHLTGADFYAHLRGLGYHLGPSFRWIGDIWIRGDEELIRFAEPDEMNEAAADYEIHPGLLDSLLQSTVGFAVRPAAEGPVPEADALAIPFAAARVDFPGRPVPGQELWGHVRAVRQAADSRDFLHVESADLHLFDSVGATVLAVDAFRFRSAPRALLEQSLRQNVRHAYALGWSEQDVRPDPAQPRPTPRRIAVLGDPEPALRAALEALGHQVTEAGPDGLRSLDADLILDTRYASAAVRRSYDDALTAVLALTHTLNEAPRHIPYATLCPVGEGAEDTAAPVREALWGLLAGVAAEQHDRRLLRIALAADWEPGTLAGALSRSLDESIPETRLRIGSGSVRVARLTPLTSDAAEAQPETPPPGDGAALITGGLGALGLSVAGFLAREGVRVITLMGRSAPDAAARQVIGELTARGTVVQVVRGDVTDPDACARAVREAGRHLPLRTVLHLAGATDDHAFEHLTRTSFEEVFAAKARGAVNLATALRDHRLAAFVMFSSASSVLGSAGQANYAAANGFLDGFAQALRAAGVPATSVDWGPWTPRAGKGGLAATEATAQAIAKLGIRPLTDEEAEPLLRLAVSAARPRLVAVAVDRERYSTQLAGHPRAALFGTARPQHAAGAAPPRGWLRDLLGGLDPEPRDDRLRDSVREAVGDVLGDGSAVDDDLGFGDMGLDSIMVIDLRTRLSHALGEDLPATVALDHPTVGRLTAHLVERLFPTESPAPAATAPAYTPVPLPRQDEADPEDLTFEELLRAVEADVRHEK
ncbi:SDR family NAD(P)-dependent oxidoreductase [Streptomyces sp. NPDC053367]|uniref:SDR family NAD(P)-dependent oxidoreductase n=1 Tax=Streptomyces sp. NPDC053367 TaxID=3365700 RepID=UPI0037D1C343